MRASCSAGYFLIKAILVKLKVSKNLLEISRFSEYGESHESMAIAYDGPEVQVAFNPQFLMEPLKALTKDEVFFEFKDEMSPGLFKTLDNFMRHHAASSQLVLGASAPRSMHDTTYYLLVALALLAVGLPRISNYFFPTGWRLGKVASLGIGIRCICSIDGNDRLVYSSFMGAFIDWCRYLVFVRNSL